MADPVATSHMEIIRSLEKCRDIELLFAELYRYYAHIFQDDAQLSQLWRKTAMEEDNHANQFVLAIKLHNKGIFESVAADILQGENTFNLVKSVYDDARQNKPAAVEALLSAIKLEEKLTQFHMDSMALFVDESYKKLFTAMMKADQGHLEKLRKAYHDMRQ